MSEVSSRSDESRTPLLQRSNQITLTTEISVITEEAQLHELPPLEHREFETELKKCCNGLKEDKKAGAREMADHALENLAMLITLAGKTARTKDELWAMIVRAAKHLCAARPAMNAATTTTILLSMYNIKTHYFDVSKDKTAESETLSQLSVPEVAHMASNRVSWDFQKRQELNEKLGTCFVNWIMMEHSPEAFPAMHILTLSNSSTIRTAIIALIRQAPSRKLKLTILESRPRCEGADMAAQLLKIAGAGLQFSVQIIPDCATAAVAKDVDIVLLGADQIRANGDVSNKIGSHAAALIVKTLNNKAEIVVVSDTDKIISLGKAEGEKEIHGSEELSEAWYNKTANSLEKWEDNGQVSVFGEWFEWVPRESIDHYITERGILDSESILHHGKAMKELEHKIFGGKEDEIFDHDVSHPTAYNSGTTTFTVL